VQSSHETDPFRVLLLKYWNRPPHDELYNDGAAIARQAGIETDFQSLDSRIQEACKHAICILSPKFYFDCSTALLLQHICWIKLHLWWSSIMAKDPNETSQIKIKGRLKSRIIVLLTVVFVILFTHQSRCSGSQYYNGSDAASLTTTSSCRLSMVAVPCNLYHWWLRSFRNQRQPVMREVRYHWKPELCLLQSLWIWRNGNFQRSTCSTSPAQPTPSPHTSSRAPPSRSSLAKLLLVCWGGFEPWLPRRRKNKLLMDVLLAWSSRVARVCSMLQAALCCVFGGWELDMV